MHVPFSALLERIERERPVFAAARQARLELTAKLVEGALLVRCREALERMERDEAELVVALREKLRAGRRQEVLAVIEAQRSAEPEPELDEADALFDRVIELRAVTAAVPPHHIAYAPAPLRHVLDALRLLTLAPGELFLDVGAGLGRVVILAALATPARASGVEDQPALCDQARRHAVAAGVDVAFHQADAVRFDYAEVAACFLFEPLERPLLDAWLEQVRRTAGELRLAVLGPSRDVLEQVPWLLPAGALGEVRRFDRCRDRGI